MKIESVRENRKEIFENLPLGEVFNWLGTYYIKTTEIETCDDMLYNAIELETGFHECFDGSELILPSPNAKLIIEP